MVTDFWRDVLAFHNGWEDRHMDAHVNIADDPSVLLT